MGQIKEEFVLTDEFSAAFSRFLQMGRQSLDTLERLGQSNQQFARSSMDVSAGIERVKKDIESMPTEIPMEWKTYEAPEVFKSFGMERTFQEVSGINELLKNLTDSQYRITQQANETQIFSPEASYDIQGLENRLASLQEMISGIESNPLNLGTDEANVELEQMRLRLNETLQLQESLNQAMQGADISAINEAYLRLSQNITNSERYLRDSFSHIPPVEIPVVWQTESLSVFTNSGIDRFRQELAEANIMLNQLSFAQDMIVGKAADTKIFPPEAVQDLSSMAERITAIRGRIDQLEGTSMDIGADKANAQLEQLRGQLFQALKEQEELNQAMESMNISSANEAYLRLQRTVGNTERHIRDNLEGQNQFNREIEQGSRQAEQLKRMVRGTVAAYLSIHTLKSVVNLSDQMVSTTSRLDLMLAEMNDKLQDTESLQEMIFRSAERSRGSYQATADMVAKLGLMAGNAFSSSAETVAFVEQINKQFRIAGTEASGIQAAMLQLTQAMASGVLRGEEYNSILEQAPNIIQNIAKYIEGNEEVLKGVAKAMKMDVDDLAGNVQKNLKDIASEGIISAELVKAAMFASADETNEKFESMPMTFEQIWTSFQNTALMAFQPVLGQINEIANSESFQEFADHMIQGLASIAEFSLKIFDLLSSGASMAAEHWDMIAPILVGVAAAAGAVAIAMLIMAAAEWATKAANDGLVTSLLSNPLTWLAIGIALIVALIYSWIQSVGGITTAWLIAKNAVLTVWDEFQIGVMTGVFAVQNWMDSMYFKTASVGVNVANSIGNMKVSVLTHIENMVNGAISLLNSFIGMLNKIPGVAISAIDKVTFSASAAASNEAAKSAREAELSTLASANAENEQARKQHLDSMRREADQNRMERLAGIAASKASAENVRGNEKDTFLEFSDIMSSGGIPALGGKANEIGKVGSVGNVKNVEGDISLADEDVKLYRDLAERRYMNQIELKTLAPNIQVTLPAGTSGNLDPQDVADALKKMLIEQMNSQTAVSHG